MSATEKKLGQVCEMMIEAQVNKRLDSKLPQMIAKVEEMVNSKLEEM